MKKAFTVFAAVLTLGFSLGAVAGTNTATTNPRTAIAATAPKAAPTYTIQISSPADQDTLTTTADTLNVTVAVIPDLDANDTVTLYVDGSASGDPAHGTSLSAPPLARGTHTLQAKINQSNGAGAESPTITVYQQGHGATSPITPNINTVAPSVPSAPMAPAAPGFPGAPIGPLQKNGKF